MKKINGYLLNNRVAELLQRVELLPCYVMIKFKEHFTDDAILASWVQYNTHLAMRKSHTTEDYITYMFDKCAEYDKKSKHVQLARVYLEELGFNVTINEVIF